MLRGRTRERAVIGELLQHAMSGHGGGVVLHGEPGIGKTALLEHATGEASGMRVLRTVGVEPESDLAYATLHRLLLPVLDRITRLPQPQARSLELVFGHASGPPPDRFLVALATLSLLSDAASEEPVLCLVDDVHWADRPSLDALAFVARRLANEPIAFLLATRADRDAPSGLSGLADLPLGGLDQDSARDLLIEHTGDQLSVAQQDKVLRATAGNPLAIRELVIGEWLGHRDEPVPMVAGLQAAFLDRVRRHGPAAQRLLLLIAADGTGRHDILRRAAAALDAEPAAGVDDLRELISTDGPTVAFRHPLIRSAVYHGATPAQRRAAHRALAAALNDDPADDPAQRDRRAWHLGQAAEGPDEEVAAELAELAERSMRRAGPASAAAALARAAELTPTHSQRAHRMVAAASAAWQGGDAARAAMLLERVEREDHPEPAVHLRMAMLRALMELRAGTPARALTLLRPVVPSALATDRRRAIELLILFGEASYHANAAGAWAEAVAAIERVPLTGDGADDTLVRLARAIGRARAGADPGLAPGDLDVVERLTDPERMCWAAGIVWGLGDRPRGRRLRRDAMQRARAMGAVGTLAWVMQFVVFDEISAGRLDTAAAFADEGHRFAVETGQPNLSCWYRGWIAVLTALRGHADQARRLAGEVVAEASTRELAAAAAVAHRALGLVELLAGRPDEALQHFQPPDPAPHAHPGIVLQNVPDLVEAAVRARKPARAAGPLDRFIRLAEATDSPELGALAARCRALMTTGGDAELAYRMALAKLTAADSALERARTQLLYGEFLRRERRKSEARTPLRAALDTFEQLGTPDWAARARAELRGAGETTDPPQRDSLATLTPQELRIARAVADGATNREIASQLFLSVRTIEYHLRKIFRNLGIRSRAELVRLILSDPNGSLDP